MQIILVNKKGENVPRLYSVIPLYKNNQFYIFFLAISIK